MTFTFKLDLGVAQINNHAKYLGLQPCECSTVSWNTKVIDTCISVNEQVSYKFATCIVWHRFCADLATCIRRTPACTRGERPKIRRQRPKIQGLFVMCWWLPGPFVFFSLNKQYSLHTYCAIR